MTATMMRRFSLALALFVCSNVAVAEIRSFSGRIDAVSTSIHYTDGYVIAPGWVDLSGLTFSTLDDDLFIADEDLNDDVDEGDDDVGNDDEDSGGGGDRILDDASNDHGSTVDIVFFHEPEDCAYTRTGCNWTELGVGASDTEGGSHWCCSTEAIDAGVCEGGPAQYGRLIVNATLFKGQHRFIPVPPSGKMVTKIRYGKFEVHKDTGKYVLVIGNCNDEGRDVYVDGTYTWASKHGYLPGELYGEMYFLIALTFAYLTVLLWYGCSMKYYEDEIIPIQRWILATIFMGLVESFFRTGDLAVWNEDGTRFWFAMYSGVIVGVMKRAISRCLLVMVSLGWGVTCDTLGATMKRIVALGSVYVGVSLARDIMTVIAINDVQRLTLNEEEELIDVVTILTLVVAAIDVIFILWILDALNGTMEDLEATNQNMKLKRYLRLRCLLLFAILFAVIWIVFALVDTYIEETILDQENEWIVIAMMEVNFLMVLIGVAVLWRPNPHAKEYAFVMELPSLARDDDEEGELESGAIPSAADDNDLALEEDESGGGYKDESPENGTQS